MQYTLGEGLYEFFPYGKGLLYFDKLHPLSGQLNLPICRKDNKGYDTY